MMLVKLIDFGGMQPKRAHYNDAGADVFAAKMVTVASHSIEKIPLGIGLELPDGYVAFVLPRSGMATKNQVTAEVVPIDSGYRGEIHAIVYNAGDRNYAVMPGEKIAQLVIVPVVIANFLYAKDIAAVEERGMGAFGSTDKAREAINIQ